MELFIQIRNGQPYEHPISAVNFREAFPHIDVNNLPPEFAKFVRLPYPKFIGVYRVITENYVWRDGIVSDNWVIRDMTAEEKQAEIAAAMLRRPEGDQWVFNEEICEWKDATIMNLNTQIGVSRV